MSILAWIIIGMGAGWLAKSVVPAEGLGGFLGDLVVGATGAVSAAWIFHSFGNPVGGSTVIAFIGAVVFLRTARLLARRRARI